VDAISFSTVTGLACPSIDARLVARMGLRHDIKRLPLFGLGCVAGAAALARAADYVRAFPDQVAAVLTVELCSLTFRPEDASIANLSSAGLCGDGASAALVTGARREARGPTIHATRSVFYPETQHLMGWNFDQSGFGIVLSPEVPVIARERVGADVDAFLTSHGLERGDIATWICHPGGPKVLLALQEALGVKQQDLAESWEHLERLGNLSSASVLMILDEVWRGRQPASDTWAVLMAMGPGFCSELLLLRW
jgi:alkylresorcinol/alkylpyrone synthase